MRINAISKLAPLAVSLTRFSLSFSLGLSLSISGLSEAQASAGFGPLSEAQARARQTHSQELLGKYYGKSTVKVGENVRKINSQIYRWTKERWRSKGKVSHQKVAQKIIDEAHRYGFDPVFLMSIIQTESSFNPRARGTSGEIGLMQILPTTAEWIAKKNGFAWRGPESLNDPLVNIRIGAAYLSYLRDRFDLHARLYIAAYNMGQGNVDHAQSKNIWPRDYPGAVMRNYVDFYANLKEQQVAPAARVPAETADDAPAEAPVEPTRHLSQI